MWHSNMDVTAMLERCCNTWKMAHKILRRGNMEPRHMEPPVLKEFSLRKFEKQKNTLF